MKVFISVDIEGVAGCLNFEEACPGGRLYPDFCRELTEEVNQVCRAAKEAGATEILIKDAHNFANNIQPELLMDGVQLIRGWEWSPYMMSEGLDETFDAAAYVAYHSAAGENGNPMSHTMSPATDAVKINGRYASEYTLNSLIASSFGVPSVLLTGDKKLCECSLEETPWLVTAPVKEGFGRSLKCLSNEAARELIYEQAKKAFSQDLKKVPLIDIPEEFNCEVSYKNHVMAAQHQYFPGCRRTGDRTVEFTAKSVYELNQTLAYILR